MKRCDNCFENNSDGATNCVICGEALPVPQLSADGESDLAAAGDSTVFDPETGMSKPWGGPQDSEFAAEEAAAAEAFEGSDIAVAISEYAEEDDDHEASDSAMTSDPVEEETPTVLLVEDDWADDVEAPASDSTMTEAPLHAEVDTPIVSDEPISEDTVPMAATGTVVLQVFHDEEPRVVQEVPIVHDITLIGREDPHRDVFPDVDIGTLESDGVSARHVSRQHLRLLRDGSRFHLFVYKGTTGTQVNKELVDPSQYGKRFEIAVGDRIILGGKVRMKLTTQD